MKPRCEATAGGVHRRPPPFKAIERIVGPEGGPAEPDAAERDRLLESIPLPARTESTLTERDRLRELVAQTQRQGFASQSEEHDDGMAAVAVQTMMVSTNTPSICTSPCCTGWATVAAAAALGALPMPASLEKSPRLTPLSSAAIIPPATPPAAA